MEKVVKKQNTYLAESILEYKLDSGLTLILLPKKGFHEVYGIMTTNFGAIHTEFMVDDKAKYYPAGIAHFLEHKLFETTDGGDLLQEFTQLGASANAYTSLYQTSYLFSTTENVVESLTLLQKMVSEAHFSSESIEREKGIIEQEIEMYLDDPDYRLYMEILASLYPQTPLAQDIAGSVSSIQDITAQQLMENFTTFYQPNQMNLVVIGDFDVNQILEAVNNFQNKLDNNLTVITTKAIEHRPILEHRNISLEVAAPKLAVGLRGNDAIMVENIHKYRLSLSLLFSMLLGWTSQNYQSFYEAGKVDSSFTLHLEVRPDYHFVVISTDTEEPIALSHSIRKILKNFETSPDVTEEHFELLKKEAYGDFIRGLNSLEGTASQFAAQYSEFENMLDLPELLAELSLADLLEAGRSFISNCDMTDFTIFPNK
ncbi:insulinase family protein [Streptococcus gallolyticus]|uniref:EF-P 5-aminopentanol modification-associated protein YfmH n=1 Tax=Streptococcus hepaticus TaxID=3349163 RepID=UPI001C95BC50|nr:insulinase family protein [Streptococcus gallolyticus]MBY5040788.1 insulinase family protein [Streptococcus gallolyticus]